MIHNLQLSTRQSCMGSLTVVAALVLYFGVRFSIKHTEGVSDIAFAPDGKSVASAGYDGVVLIWDVNTGMVRSRFGHAVGVFSVAYSPDGKTLAAETWADNRRVIELRDSDSAKLRASILEHPHQGHAVRYSPDGQPLGSRGSQ